MDIVHIFLKLKISRLSAAFERIVVERAVTPLRTRALRAAELVLRLRPGTLASCLDKHTAKAAAATALSPQRYILRGKRAAMAAETEKVEPAESEQDEEEDVYEVERIIDMRVEEVTVWASSTLAAGLA